MVMLIVLATVVAPVTARIFSRRPVGGNVVSLLETMGGQAGYRSRMRVNGSSAELVITAFEDPRRQVAGEILAALNLEIPLLDVDSLHRIEKDGMVTRLLLLTSVHKEKTLAITISQTADEHRRRRTPDARDFDPLPLFPGSEPSFAAVNEDTGLVFGTLSARAAGTEAITAFYQSAMVASGWLAAFPENHGSAGLMFLRADGLCMVLVTPEDHAQAGSRITLMYKPLKGAAMGW